MRWHKNALRCLLLIYCILLGAASVQLPEFEIAAKLGFRALECDVRVTKDSQIVACHDASLLKMCGWWIIPILHGFTEAGMWIISLQTRNCSDEKCVFGERKSDFLLDFPLCSCYCIIVREENKAEFHSHLSAQDATRVYIAQKHRA